jgi:uncharacterized protein (TIGR03086 family)
MIDMTEACRATAGVLLAVTDDQLPSATPCEQMDLAALVAHVGGLSSAFAAAARKQFGELTDGAPGMTLEPDQDWRTSYPQRLLELAEAWRDPAAWQGMSRAGGVDFPADVGGLIALTEVVIHGWDIARASGQPYDVPDDVLVAVLPHVTSFAEQAPVEGLFAAAVPVDADAPLLDRVVAMTGRDPRWSRQG